MKIWNLFAIILLIVALACSSHRHIINAQRLDASNVDFCQSVVDNYLMYQRTAAPPPSTPSPGIDPVPPPTSTTTSTILPPTTTTTENTTATAVTASTTANEQDEMKSGIRSALNLGGHHRSSSSIIEDDEETTWQQPQGVDTPVTNGDSLRVRVPIFPVTFKLTSQSSFVAQTDIIARLQQQQSSSGVKFGPQAAEGGSLSANYKFFQTLAVASQGINSVIDQFPATMWDDLNSMFPSSSSSLTTTKPYILDPKKILNQFSKKPEYAAAWKFGEMLSQVGASLSDLRERLAVGYLTVVAVQSKFRENGVCSDLFSIPSGFPWPMVNSRTMLALVVGISKNNIYLIDPCSMDVGKIDLKSFAQRWRSFEVNSDSGSNNGGASANSVSVSNRAMYFMVNSTKSDFARVVKQGHDEGNIFGNMMVGEI